MESAKTQYSNQKVTMVLMNSMGLVIVRKVSLQVTYLKGPYKWDYKLNLVVQYIEKGKRKPVAHGYEQIAIFDGWQGEEFKLPNEFFVGEFNNATYETAKSKFQNLIIEHITK